MPGALLALSQPAKRHLSWGEVDWLIECIVSRMRQDMHYSPTHILPIGGGGLIPASILAYRFYKKAKIPIETLAPIYAKSYGHNHKQQELNISWPNDIREYDRSSTLIVDDIVDTGATFRAVRHQLPNSTFFSLVTKISGPDYWGTRDTKNEWWVFPWEKDGINQS